MCVFYATFSKQLVPSFGQVRNLAASFSTGLRAHLFLAFQHLQLVNSQQALEGERDFLHLLMKEENSECPKDLFQVLFYSQEQPTPWQYLLTEAVTLRSPPLTVLAACHQVGGIYKILYLKH